MSPSENRRQAFIAVGANLSDRLATINQALAALSAHAGIAFLQSSSVHETAPHGVEDQPPFLNLVLGVETTLGPEDLLALLLDIERLNGRVRTRRWGPRTLDLDLLVYENQRRAAATLELPHPRMLERPFVTVPLRELLDTPRFGRPVWDPLRVQLASLPGPAGTAIPLPLAVTAGARSGRPARDS